MAQKNGVRFSWSWDNCSLPISKCNKSGANSMKELPEAKKRLTKNSASGYPTKHICRKNVSYNHK